MFLFDRLFYVDIPRVDSAFVHQLTEAEQRSLNIDILHIGAVCDIKNVNKEVIRMVEKLKAYVAELEAIRTEVENTDYSEAINKEVMEFRAATVKKYEDAKVTALAKVDSDIACVNSIIERECALAAAEELTPDTQE